MNDQPRLEELLHQLSAILQSIPFLESQRHKPPIIDREGNEQNGHPIVGLRSFKDAINREIEILEQFLADPNQTGSDLSTNASYFVAVWNEILSAPPPVVAICKTFDPPADLTLNSRNAVKHTSYGAKSLFHGVKVDVVADGGRTWIRVNTMKNSRILAEFREIDSYSDSDDDAPTAADNSLLRMGRSLVAARAGTSTQPNVILRLTRLQTNGEADPRIAQTISTLQDMGLATQFGERAFHPAQPSSPPPTPAPTRCVNLDLSILIALVSDLTHAELPRSEDDAYARFCIPSNARSWRRCAPPKLGHIGGSSSEDSSKHSRALSLQCIQEMHHGLITEIMSRFKSNPHVEFWATAKARARCLQIVDKIGGADEKRRAHALLTAQPSLARDTDASRRVESDFWRNSRYSSPSPPLLPIPIRIHPQHHSPPRMSSLFWVTLIQTCQHILAHEPHRKVESENRSSETATVITAHPKLTVHTMESLLVGACAGMTTLTANRASIRVLLREMEMERMRRGDGEDVACGMGSRDTLDAAVWILEPRSLAEGMRADLQTVK